MNKIIIPTSLGIVAVILVAFVSFDIMSQENLELNPSKLVIEENFYTWEGASFPPQMEVYDWIGVFEGGVTDRTEEYIHLTEIFEKYDDLQVFEIYREHKNTDDPSIILDFAKDELGLSDDEALKFLESQRNDIIIEDKTHILLTADPFDEDMMDRDIFYVHQGIWITLHPKGDYTQERLLEHQNTKEIIYEVSPNIIGELTPMGRVIQNGEPFDYITMFDYIDNENTISIRGFLTNEQVSALAMAISEYKKP